MSNARTAAVAAFALAMASPSSADWQAVAEAFMASLPKPKAQAGDAPAWWSDYAIPRSYWLDGFEVLFADGEAVRCNVVQSKGKPPRIAEACRSAVGFYRARHGQVAVPRFASLRIVETGQAYDATECSRLTDDVRAAPGTVQGQPMTAGRIAMMEAEVERRKAGLQRALYQRNLPTAERASSACHATWIAAVRAGEKELRMMREAFACQRGESLAVAEMAPAVALITAPVASIDPDEAQAAWCEAVADTYGACAAGEIIGTFEAEAGCLSPSATALEIQAVLSTDDTTTKAAQIMPEIMPAPAAEAWEPTEATHPVVAYCLSERARLILFERVQDGTFPAAGRTARAGVWCLSLADAQDLQDVGSIRFAGMPRKPYTRRAAPTSPTVRVHVPSGSGFSISHHGIRPVVLHHPIA